MARKRQTQEDTHLSDAGTSSKEARLAAEAERQAAASAERARIVKETKSAHTATQAFLAAKPTDSRTIADTR
jgi:hypothetical protein